MRSFFIAFTSLMLLSAGTAQAKVEITIDKDNQQMTVAVDGVARYHWPVSTGIPSRETPNGAFRAFRMEEDHFSREFDDAPMPHSIFFTKVGHAIHGTDSVSRLGTPASHGCVRLSRQNASTLYALVQQQGVLNTTVTLTGSAQVALARNPRGRNAVARAPQPAEEQYATTGDPVNLAPPAQPARRYMPQDDNYIYPADGSDTGARYPAPRSASRPLYDAQSISSSRSHITIKATASRATISRSRGNIISRAAITIRTDATAINRPRRPRHHAVTCHDHSDCALDSDSGTGHGS